MTLSETNETSETPLSEKSKTTLSQISGMAGLLEYLTRDDIVASGRHTELQKKVCGYCVEKELQINSWLSGSERPYSTFGYAVEISDDVSDDVEMAESNELVSEQRSPDGLKVVMHPMVLLSISDYMTRHTMRNQPGPVVGALLGSLDGRELHLVQVFDMKLILPKDDEGVKLDLEWLAERVSQFKAVHKGTPIDLVGWWATSPSSGPLPEHMELHRQVLAVSESAVFIAFHPSTVAISDPTDTKLPLTVYESIRDSAKGTMPDAIMDGAIGVEHTEVQADIRFRTLDYELEMTAEELIAVRHIATEANDAGDADLRAGGGKSKQPDGATGAENGPDENDDDDEDDCLTHEERELIASLTVKANAIKMFRARLNLIAKYVANLPPAPINDHSSMVDAGSKFENLRWRKNTETNHSLLRQIEAMITKMELIDPPDSEALKAERSAQEVDAMVVVLIGAVANSMSKLAEMNQKYNIIDAQKSSKRASAAAEDRLQAMARAANAAPGGSKHVRWK